MAKIGCLKPFRGSYSNLANVVLEDGEIAFATDNGAIYFGDGVNAVKDINPFINTGNTDISGIGTGTITNAISTLNSKIGSEPQLIFDFDVSSTGWNNYTNTSRTKQTLLDNARYVLVMFKPQNSNYWFPTIVPWFGGTLWTGTGEGTYCYVGSNSYSYLAYSKNENYSGVINLFQWYGAIGKCKLYAIS